MEYGKSTFSTFFAKSVENENQKTLLIDFDFTQNQSKLLFKVKRNPEYDGNIEKLVININKNLDILCNLDLVFNEPNMANFIKLQEMLNNVKQNYNLIIIDTSSNLQNEYTKRIFYNSDDIIFLLEPNILGVKKSKDLLEIIENDFKVDNSKIRIVLNKTNIYQISDNIIEELFPDIKLLGKIKYHDAYNLMINKNIHKKEIKKEYEKIYRNLIKK